MAATNDDIVAELKKIKKLLKNQVFNATEIENSPEV